MSISVLHINKFVHPIKCDCCFLFCRYLEFQYSCHILCQIIESLIWKIIWLNKPSPNRNSLILFGLSLKVTFNSAWAYSWLCTHRSFLSNPMWFEWLNPHRLHARQAPSPLFHLTSPDPFIFFLNANLLELIIPFHNFFYLLVLEFTNNVMLSTYQPWTDNITAGISHHNVCLPPLYGVIRYARIKTKDFRVMGPSL